MNWNDLRYVLAIARAGTLAGAARRLRVNQTTAARRLAAAEAALGARLFDRKEGALLPTAAGKAAISRAADMEQAVEALEGGVSDSDAVPAGAVRLTAVPVLANRLLIPALPELYSAHPRLEIELIAEPRNLSLTRREADVALRLARPTAGTALARRIGRLDYAVYGPRRAGAESLPWITYEEGQADLPQARWIAAAAGEEGGSSRLMVNDAEAILEALRAGLGKSLLPCFAAERERQLKRLSGAAPVLSREIWLLVHRELRPQARIAAVIAWLERVVEGCGVAERAPRRRN